MNPLSSLLGMLIIAKDIGITLLVKIRSDTAFRRRTAYFSRVNHIPCPPAPPPQKKKKKGSILVLLQIIRVNYGHPALCPSSALTLPMSSQPL